MTGYEARNLEGTRAVVTGAGRGLGKAIALVLAECGCAVTLCGRSRGSLERVAEAIARRGGARPETVHLDLASAPSIETACADLLGRYSAIDLLVNNGAAWLGRRDAPYEAAEVHAVVASAVNGTFLFTQGLLPALARSKRPDIVTIGSVTGLPGSALHATSVPFHAAKHGQVALADGFRQMLAGTPVRSICINPPWLEDMSPEDAAWAQVGARRKGQRATNRDVVEAVLFAITRPRHVTIASLTIDSDLGGIDATGHAGGSGDDPA